MISTEKGIWKMERGALGIAKEAENLVWKLCRQE